MTGPGAQPHGSTAGLAGLVRELRERALLSQEELAARSGLSVSTIRGLEAGRIRRPRISSVRQLAGALGLADVDLDRLVAVVRGEPTHDHATVAGAGPVPAQLPAAVACFAGRGEALRELDAMLAADGPAPVVVTAISGTAGIGKTAVAVHWAHRVASRFPDGILYVNLRGFHADASPLDPATALRGFLDALGVPSQRIPSTLDAQTGLYRSLLAGRRMLVLLDNARDADQVRPLLPGAPVCLAVVTSRNQLASLVVAEGARLLTVDSLPDGEARQLLANRLGPDRVAAEPAATDEIIRWCGGLPLALAVVAARAATQKAGLSHLADQLGQGASMLDALHGPDPATDVRSVFSWSYRSLAPETARMFRLLGLHPGPDISIPAAASLAAIPVPDAHRLLADLVTVNLATEHTPGRYQLHDLIRAYATDLAHATVSEPDRDVAMHRMLDYYLHTAYAARHLLDPPLNPMLIPLARPASGTAVESLADGQEAMDWLGAEHPTLLAALHRAADTTFHTHAWQLAWTLDTYLYRRGYWHQDAAAWQRALHAARRLDNPRAEAFAHRLIANVDTALGRHDDAHRHLRRALDLSEQVGDRIEQAYIHGNRGYLHERQGNLREALHHSQRALAVFREAGHQRGTARALNAVGWYHALLADHTQALGYCEQALTLSQHIGDRRVEAAAWDSLGYAYHHLRRDAQAIDCYRRAVALYSGIDDRYNEADALNHLGDAHCTGGESEAAGEAWAQAFEILSELGHPDADRVKAKLAAGRQV